MSTPAPAIARPRWRRPRVLVILAVVVVALAATVTGVVLATRSTDDPKSSTRIGAQFRASSSTSEPGAVVRLPGGVVTISLDRSPVDRPEDARGEDVPAPDGGRLVLLRWRGVAAPGLQVVAARPVARPVTITLVTAGRRFPLLVDAATIVQPLPLGGAWVAVPGDASDARVDIGYAGVVQRANPLTKTVDKRRATLLYATAPDGGVDCDVRATGGQKVDERDRPECSVTASRTAYVEGLGWAPSGRAWLVVSTKLDLLSHVIDDGVDYFLSRPGTIAFRYAGRSVTPAGVGGAPGPGFGFYVSPNPGFAVVAAVGAQPGAAQSFTATVRTRAVNDDDDGFEIDSVPVTLSLTAAVT